MSSAVVRWPDTDADQSLYTDGHNYNKHVCIVYGAISWANTQSGAQKQKPLLRLQYSTEDAAASITPVIIQIE